ncbi:MAG: DUF3300 domain-containing protein [Bryobacteraceae bacterium]
MKNTTIQIIAALAACVPLMAQQPYPQQPYPTGYPAPYSGAAPVFAPQQLDGLVSQIALYPDPLLAQVLTAATFPDQIPQAAGWANAHRYLNGDALANAIYQDRLPWDPSVLALLPFPSVLDTMARDQGWTRQLGSAVLAQRPEVMDAVQRMRQRAMDYGYLRNTPQERIVMGGPGAIEILPVDPGYYYVPVYNPAIVFGRRGGVGAVISFGPRVFIGASFAPWGWRDPRLDWRAHTVVIDQRPWDRTWVNRDRYVHAYAAPPRERVEGPRVERHERDIRNRDRGEHRDR